MFAFLAQLGDEGRIGFHKTIAEFFKLTVADLHIPGRFDRAPTLLELRGVGLRQMALGIALHVNNAELHIGLGKQALAYRKQSGKVIVDDDHHAAQSAFDQPPEYRFPIFEIFTAMFSDAAEHALLAVAAQTDNQVDTRRTELIAIAQLDVFSIDK